MATKGYKARPITSKTKDSSKRPAPFKQTKEKSFANKAGHLALDLLGFVDVWGIGTGADLINAGWYAGEGDKTMLLCPPPLLFHLEAGQLELLSLGLKGQKL